MNRRTFLLSTLGAASVSGCTGILPTSPQTRDQTRNLTSTRNRTTASPAERTTPPASETKRPSRTEYGEQPAETTESVSTDSQSVLPLEVDIASTRSPPSNIDIEIRFQQTFSDFLIDSNSTAHFNILLSNTANRSRSLKLLSRGVFSNARPIEQPSWVLATPTEADALWSSTGRVPGCWQFSSDEYAFYPNAQFERIELGPGESITSKYELWVDPERETCWPTGSYRFDSYDGEYVVETEGEEKEFSWGFTLDITPR